MVENGGLALESVLIKGRRRALSMAGSSLVAVGPSYPSTSVTSALGIFRHVPLFSSTDGLSVILPGLSMAIQASQSSSGLSV